MNLGVIQSVNKHIPSILWIHDFVAGMYKLFLFENSKYFYILSSSTESSRDNIKQLAIYVSNIKSYSKMGDS